MACVEEATPLLCKKSDEKFNTKNYMPGTKIATSISAYSMLAVSCGTDSFPVESIDVELDKRWFAGYV